MALLIEGRVWLRLFSMLFRTSNPKNFDEKIFSRPQRIRDNYTKIYWGERQKCGAAHREMQLGAWIFGMLFGTPNLTYFSNNTSSRPSKTSNIDR